MLDADEFDAWFRLLESPGLGRDGVRRLLAAFGSPRQVLQASTITQGFGVAAHVLRHPLTEGMLIATAALR